MDIKTIETDAEVTKSWLANNYHYALAIAIGALILGVGLGMRIGVHMVC